MGNGDDRTHTPDVVWLRRTDPLASVSSGRPHCPESPHYADNSPDRLRDADEEDVRGEAVSDLFCFKGFIPTN